MKKLIIIFLSIATLSACKSKSTEADRNVNVIYPTANNKSSILSDTAATIAKPDTVYKTVAAPPIVETKVVYVKEKPERKYNKSSSNNSNNNNDNSSTSNTDNTVSETKTAPVPKDKKVSKAAQGAAIGAGTGAVIGAAVSKNKGKGAIIGAILGAGAGYGIGRDKDKKSGRVERKRAKRRAANN